jgi:DUF4097 and DUF4098 domain-containing protein YvlB
MKDVWRFRGGLVAPILCVCLSVSLSALANELREEFRQTYPLEETGALNLSNVNGSVHVTAWDRAEVLVEAVKRAKNQADLDAVKIEITASKDRLRVQSKYPDKSERRRGNSATVEYTLKVPKRATLENICTVNGGIDLAGTSGPVKSSTVNGELRVKDLAGKADLSTVNGGITAEFREAILEANTKVTTVNGGIRVTLPRKTNAQVKAATVNGRIHSELELKVKGSFFVGARVDGQLGEGGPELKLSTVNGSIQLCQAD